MVAVPKIGPDPTLLSRSQVDALYETFQRVYEILRTLQIPFIVTGGTLLGAIRQHSILFCDDDIDIAILVRNEEEFYQLIAPRIQQHLDPTQWQYQVRPWEAGDRIRPVRMNTVFIDVFLLRRYETVKELIGVIGRKKNGTGQATPYIHSILSKIQQCATTQGEISPLFPLWHFTTRKAIELWPREVYRHHELFPLNQTLKFGPLVNIPGPRMPVLLLRRAFGEDCFTVYYPCPSHQQPQSQSMAATTTTTTAAAAASSSSSSGFITNESSQETTGISDPPTIYEPCLSTTSKAKTTIHGGYIPIVAPGGRWESATKLPLQEEHYHPMQPLSRMKRRFSGHNRQQLMEYLRIQSAQERTWMLEGGGITHCSQQTHGDKQQSREQVQGGADQQELSPLPTQPPLLLDSPPLEIFLCNPIASTKRRTVYMDGVFDLFHIGHLEAIKHCARLGDRVCIGVTGDDDATGYKRKPIINQVQRSAIVAALRDVDEVVCPCPLVVTKDFMNEHGIDLVVHGFANEADAQRQEEFFAAPAKMGQFQRISYYSGLSTTDIINSIKLNESNDTDRSDDNPPSNRTPAKPQWFGSCLSAATNYAMGIPFDPFPLTLRQVVEPHIEKARNKRKEALQAICDATGVSEYDAIMSLFGKKVREGVLPFNTKDHPLLEAFLETTGLPQNTNLCMLHQPDRVRKDSALYQFTRNWSYFQEVYDNFVRQVCVPYLNEQLPCDEVFYQCFPCVRIVQPGEFSIGPHADVMYGHHPCSINFYVLLTDIIDNSSALFVESRVGSEDWHPLSGTYGFVHHFAGALCLHWTTENHTEQTRVSLDFRLIPGSVYHSLKSGGSQPNGKLDVYRDQVGYYSSCGRTIRETGDAVWERTDFLHVPDARMGFPWTAKGWANSK